MSELLLERAFYIRDGGIGVFRNDTAHLQKIYVAKPLCTLQLILIALRTSYVKGTFDDVGMANMLGN